MEWKYTWNDAWNDKPGLGGIYLCWFSDKDLIMNQQVLIYYPHDQSWGFTEGGVFYKAHPDRWMPLPPPPTPTQEKE